MKNSTIIGYVIMNLVFWGAVFTIALKLDWELPPFKTEDGTFYPAFWWGTIFNALIFYGNAYIYLLYKERNHRLPLFLLGFILVLVATVIESVGDYLLANHMKILPDLYSFINEELSREESIIVLSVNILYAHLFFFFTSFVNVFYLRSRKNEQIQEGLAQEKLNAELKYLKAQLNPHFLFNGINSVYHLIDPKPAIAKDTLLKFSNLLRYQLYECNDDLIPLEKELAHIQDYVEMEKIRKGEDATIELKLPEDTYGIKIPPLLFTPFIENTFKYVSNHDDGEKNKITITIRLIPENNKLRFEAQNTIDENNMISKGGIGIANVKKRLALLFPNQHDLDIINEPNHFVVRMSLNLKNEAS